MEGEAEKSYAARDLAGLSYLRHAGEEKLRTCLAPAGHYSEDVRQGHEETNFYVKIYV